MSTALSSVPATRRPSRRARTGPLNGRRAKSPTATPLGAIAGGLAAGALGTLAMDIYLLAGYKRGGGERGFLAWEFSSDLKSWEGAPAPALVAKRLVEGLFQLELPPERAALVNNAAHWAFGIQAGAQFGLIAGSLTTRHAAYGLPFGASVWAGGYIVLPPAGLYQPIWKYDRRTLAKDLSAHLVYGLSTAAAFELVSASK